MIGSVKLTKKIGKKEQEKKTNLNDDNDGKIIMKRKIEILKTIQLYFLIIFFNLH